MSGPAAALAIFCGAGLSGCGPSRADVKAETAFVWTEPGIFTMAGTGITLEYRPVQDDWLVRWHDANRTAADWNDAVVDAWELAMKLRRVGFIP